MNRREFIAALGSAAMAWPFAARAQQRERMRRIGFILSALPADDPEGQARITAFVQGLQQLGWTDGRNLRIDFRWGLGDAERLRRYSVELVALAPDVLFAGGSLALAALQQATRTLPIVFANVVDPVGLGNVASLARPGGNTTGFMNVEFGLSGKWLELLKQVAPHVTRVAVLRDPATPAGIGALSAIQAVAPSFGVELTPVGYRDVDEIERGITAFARGPSDGVVVTGQLPQDHRRTIIGLAARLRLPAVYPFRGFVVEGGLLSFGNDQAEPYRLAAGYVDRILKGAKPADLPVQTPTRFETVLNLKTAKALGLQVPDMVRLRADEVIE
jgi:putative tryptophan/tyrosine transport system substrate-binding protein